MPGALPFANQAAILKTYLIAKAVGCRLAQTTDWERKNYFYPDLPKGFQISQYALPIGERGNLAGIGVRRVHLEEDTGKLIHEQQRRTKENKGEPKENKGEQRGVTLVDFNRSGVPLVELVTEPEISSAKQAATVAKEYQLVLRYLKVSDADMEKGQFRVEANVSLRQPRRTRENQGEQGRTKENKGEQGVKVEIKNLNSFRAVERAIDYEIKRQSELLASGKVVVQETMGWSEPNQATVSQRTKETESDYRYFREPDLPPVTLQGITKGNKGVLRLPELPQDKRRKLKAAGLPDQYLEVLAADPELVARFEGILGKTKDDKGALRLALARLLVNRPQTQTMPAPQLIKLAELPDHQLKRILKGEATGDDVGKVSDAAVDQVVATVITQQVRAVRDYRSGKHAVLGFLVGQVVKQLPSTDPKVVVERLKQLLG